MDEPPVDIDAIASDAFHVARGVRKDLGAGLYESAYKRLLVHRLRAHGHRVEEEVLVRHVEDGIDLGICGRIDVVVDDVLVLELKAVTRSHPIFSAQLLTYLRLASYPIGLLINFNAIPFREGIERRVYSPAFGRPIRRDPLSRPGVLASSRG